ncbi:MAG: hypothetical protein JXO22_10475 [Phycisphaerae bacterium]|nr:hypothetical protein [Phycisphaerae bacterium]
MALPNRRYQRRVDEIGPTEKFIGVGILVALTGIVVGLVYHVRTDREYLFDVALSDYAGVAGDDAAPVSPSSVTDESASNLAEVASDAVSPTSVFPDSGLAEWRKPTETREYSADDLYIEIDGRAPAYLERGCTGLVVGTYQHIGEEDRGIDVYVFAMATPENARAMYDAELPPDAEQFKLGQAAYEVGGSVFLCIGPNYVQIMPYDLEESSKEAALKIAERIAGN